MGLRIRSHKKKLLAGASFAALLIGAGLGTMALLKGGHAAPAVHPPVYSRAGRDKALLNLIEGAERTIYIRTERLNLVAVTNALLQRIQDKQRRVTVRVELPMGYSSDLRLVQVLLDTGATVELSSEPGPAYQGTYLLVDGHRFLYSAAALDLAPPGTPRAYVESEL